MIDRKYGYLECYEGEVPAATRELHDRGFAVLQRVLGPGAVSELAEDIARVFDEYPPDARRSNADDQRGDLFRYEMLNRSEACQRAIGKRKVLDVIEPLLGSDCHIIANTAWRNPARQAGAERGDIWHIDAGPHVPRPPGTEWPDEIPYPVFVVAAHFLLLDSRIEDGPTAAIPGSHLSGQHPPFRSMMDESLAYGGEGAFPMLGRAGDVVLFVSDVWHRRLPTKEGAQGRFFLQAHYARRDIAQRLRPTAESNSLSSEAVARAKTKRERKLIGLHDQLFYDG